MIWFTVVIVLAIVGSALLLRWGTRWGSTAGERALGMPGDQYLETYRGARLVMTRAISIAAPPERVWPWIAQQGRGAGWYSVDWLDNGRRVSARHVVSWIPEPRLGDAAAIGYLRHLDTGKSLAWWLDGGSFLGSRPSSVTCFTIAPEGAGTRVISRISANTTGATASVALFVFRIIDSIMARSQLLGLRQRVERLEVAPAEEIDPETGARDQYQLYEIIYASGDRAGVAGEEEGALWREAAIRDGILKS